MHDTVFPFWTYSNYVKLRCFRVYVRGGSSGTVLYSTVTYSIRLVCTRWARRRNLIYPSNAPVGTTQLDCTNMAGSDTYTTVKAIFVGLLLSTASVLLCSAFTDLFWAICFELKGSLVWHLRRRELCENDLLFSRWLRKIIDGCTSGK